MSNNDISKKSASGRGPLTSIDDGFKTKETETILKIETTEMYNELRSQIQAGERNFARVNERDHTERLSAAESLEQDALNAHPYLNSQQYDGIDPNVTPVPTDDPELWRRFQAELDLQKKLRMELNNSPSNTIKPRGPM